MCSLLIARTPSCFRRDFQLHNMSTTTSIVYPRSPGTHIVESWVIDSKSLYKDPRTGTQYIGNWASRDSQLDATGMPRFG